MKTTKKFQSFNEFFPFYLGEHSNRINRRLHFIGTSLVILVVLITLMTREPKTLYYAPLIGYGFAWVGHFFFEKNKPATFKHPVYSLIGDFVMWKQILTGRIKI